MRNIDKKLKFNFSISDDVEFGEDAEAGACERVVNMRSVGSVLQPVGKFLSISTLTADERLLACHRTADGVNMIILKNRKLILHGAMRDGAYCTIGVEIGTLASDALCAETLCEFVVIGCTAGDVYLHYENGSYVMLRQDDLKPVLSVASSLVDAVTVSVPQYQLVGGYSRWQLPLEADDVANISASMRAAYSEIASVAKSCSAYIQPVLVRYAVRLFDDSYAWISEPVLLGSGVQCCSEYRAEVESNGSSYTTVGGFQISADIFTITVNVVGGIAKAWDNLIKSIDILVSEESSPLLVGQNVTCRCETSTVGTRKSFLMMQFKSRNVKDVVRSVVESKTFKVAYKITDFDALRAGDAVLLPVVTGEAVTGEMLKSCTARVSKVQCSTSFMPHSRRMFGAGDYCRLRSSWASAGILNVDESNDETFEAVVTACIGTVNGEAVTVWRGQGYGKPVSVGPIVAYPDIRAKRISVAVKLASGAVKTFSAALHPALSAGMSYMVSDDLKPFELNDASSSDYIIPNEVNLQENITGKMTESEEFNPLVIKEVHAVCDGRIRALGASLHHSDNVIGTPIYAFADSGVYALPYRTVVSSYAPSVMVTSHVIAASTKPVNADGVLNFISDEGELLSISKYKVERRLKNVDKESSMTYILKRKELWISSQQNGVTIVADDGRTYLRGEKYGNVFSSSAGVPMAVAVNGVIYDISQEIGNLAEVDMITQPFSPDDVEIFVPKEFSLNISASNCRLEITIYGDTGISCHGMMLCRFIVDGALNSPLKAKIISPRLRKMRVKMCGRISYDAVVEGFVMKYKTIY